MKGKLIKDDEGWWVQHKAKGLDGNLEYIAESMLHPDDVKQIEEDAKMFDNIEARIAAYPDVEFEMVTEVVASIGDSEQQDEYTVSYAKLILSKEQQKELITEIMNEDAKDGLYEDKIKVTIKKDSEAAKAFESLREDKQAFKENVQSGKFMPLHIKEKIDKLTDELKKVYELAEESWEGCDGCDENDKNFWMNGFRAGYNRAKPDELLDEQIGQAGEEWCHAVGEDGFVNSGDDYDIHELPAFIAGAKWYKEQLKQRQ